ncbi:head decoration protein [Sapientia aquatica]|uniref:Head decoration protein n=1 Tax=Sapientia aquatica TaxID=1549640 RepID=A0A4R5W1K8_9BURK|nr:head decoration protein [Sapientia aquatica]TDK65983.1 head decoration protein [Sapientia aquatica]
MVTQIQPKTLADLLLIEVSAGWSKKTAPIKAGPRYPMGTVLSVTNGVYAPLDLAGSATAKKAAAVLAKSLEPSTTDTQAIVIARGAVVAIDELIWPNGITPAQKANALAELDERGIDARAALLL